MKKILLSLLFISGFVASGFGQIFSQNFATEATSAEVSGLYVSSSAPGNSKFTAISTSTNSSASVVGGKLIIDKTSTSSNLATISYGGAAISLGSQVLKIKFSFQVNGTPSAGAGFTVLAGSTALANNNTVQSGAMGSHSRFAFTYTGNPGEYTVKPVGFGTASAAFSGAQTITFVINNLTSGGSLSYEAPNGSRETLPNDTWDLWIGNTRVFNDVAADGPTNSLDNFKLVTPSSAVVANVSFDDFVVTNETEPTTLPVSLTSFTAKANLQNIDLAWSTATETDNSHFDILRSGDGKTFTKIGDVKGNGTTDIAKNYTFIDKNALPGVNYYQLKQVDNNGNLALSEVEAVKSNVAASNLKVAASKQDGTVKLTVFAANEGKATFKIYDLNGRKITEQALNLSKGYSNVSVPFNGGNGLHIASLTTATETVTQKFIQ
ncbi:MAG: T9SS type A sorting domain-containing protein [Pedobacter sp.]|uniref:T9SS type A sorting domain-containing protein n=1 Tax=Pedobacter sp. TaxID=1411316 RepID=UPI002806C3D6|nr:T9SS type A sorting domain-containing protein [Pedobacter sp.]MDQ8005638.1 T9SS type A sorting domain-containing protein [Pedobacter sp.]